MWTADKTCMVDYRVLWQTDHTEYGRKVPRDAAIKKVRNKDSGKNRFYRLSVGAQPA